ncbi:N-methyl-L-tryptophan oxidase [Amphibacillus marinus]|uniref:N-methyl-L-tryptophan oxidase n=1 Tax=Amphibacillus marinus TaxID=872970 RepID=A0A1H8KAJ1_9BACI|nr:N-methyl-L-tryptophan oxidase [Amphibacillus marinus]SEN89536.1 N-methyl-L-tryptophan oxidase [Amphibacillus marinus]
MNYDVIIVGAGAMGLATGYYLTQKGVQVLMLDAYDPPHEQGSHGGETRLIRHAYGEGRGYTPLAIRSQGLWDELQQLVRLPILKKTGVLSFAQTESSFIKEIQASAHDHHLPLQLYNHEQLKQRFAGLRLPKAEHMGCFEPSSGVLYVDQALRSYRALAIEAGAHLKVNHPVDHLKINKDDIIVYSRGKVFTGKQLLLATGAWQPTWFKTLNLNVKLTVKRQMIGWFEANEALFDASVFPGFTAETETGLFYGFPSIDGSGVKVGRHDYGTPVNPNHFDRDFSAADEAELRSFLTTWLPEAAGRLIKGKTCLYTMTEDEDFVIDCHPEHSHIWLAAGFSGHGFKFASGIGESLADRMVNKTTIQDLAMFSINRFIVNG